MSAAAVPTGIARRNIVKLLLFSAFALLFESSLPLAAQSTFPINLTNLQGAVLAQAAPDDCWIGLGKNQRGDFPPCPEGQTPKVNQSYVWSMVQTGNLIWFGTTANPLCTDAGDGAIVLFDSQTPYANSSWACEYGKSPYSPTPYDSAIGDLRPPRIYVYNLDTQTLQDITPTAAVTYDDPWGVAQPVLDTLGFRAAAVVGNAVVFAGPSIHGGLNFLAFSVSNFSWLAEGSLSSQYEDIRQFAWADGVLYAGVRTTRGGSVLRYTGTIPASPSQSLLGGNPSCNSCFTFTDVQDFDNEAAGLYFGTDGRLYVGTWPVNSPAGIYMSPPVPQGGFTSGGATWTQIFSIAQYEPDPAIVYAYGIGTMAEFGGYLYFGTQTPPYGGLAAYSSVYGKPTSDAEGISAAQHGFRSSVFFNMSGQTTGAPQLNLLYGDAQLWVYTAPPLQPHGGTWALAPNLLTGQAGIYGTGGFGNPYNAYTWSMAVWNNKLYVGTFDWTYIQPLLPVGSLGVVTPLIAPTNPAGADLFSFASTGSPAEVESNSGIGNPTSYGVRNLLPSTNQLFVGMANPMNLLTTPGAPNGGWELIELVPK
jgi:hypothetical protein